LLLLCLSAAGLPAQPPNVERELDDAKALYREADLAGCVARLEPLVARLRVDRPLEHRRELGEAYLFLGLAYVGLKETASARARFVELARLDPTRRLDPEEYAPKVLDLFEEARKQVAADTRRKDCPPLPAPGWITPTNGAIVSGTVALECAMPSSYPQSCYRGVLFREGSPQTANLDTAVVATIRAPPYAATWDSTSVPNGRRDLICVAAVGFAGVATANRIMVNVNNR